MIIAVASGKGGTGKTTIAVNLAYSIGDAQLLDCDVEEPNAHLFLKPDIQMNETVGVPVPAVDASRCSGCGRCGEVCAYSAIVVIDKRVAVFPDLCHGCGACAYFCPEKAISENLWEIGVVSSGRAGSISFAQGLLNIGRPMAVPVIRKVKERIESGRTVILDAPPGVSCPVVETVKGADFCVLVTEPTPFGLNDLTIAAAMVRAIGVPFGVVINSSSIGDDGVSTYCAREGIPVLLSLPWDRRIAEEYSAGRLIIQRLPEYHESFHDLFESIKSVKANLSRHEATHGNKR